MAAYSFQSITPAQAAAYNGAVDSLSLGGLAANLVTALFLTDQVSISLNGRTVLFGTGVQLDTDMAFDNGGLILIGSSAADTITGTAGMDGIFGGAGVDSLSGGDGDDVIQGNQGADTLVGGAGNDSIFGGQEGDLILLGTGANESNWANGNKGDDIIIGSPGADTLLGGQDNDRIEAGGPAGDFLNGNLGDDTIIGGSGNDTITGDLGYDRMTGGGGADIFIFGVGSSDMHYEISDRILDWSADDRISMPVKTGYTEINVPTSNKPPFDVPPGDPNYQFYGSATVYDAYGVPYRTRAEADAGQTYIDAEVAADNLMHSNAAIHIVATQSGINVVVFADADADGHAELSIILTGVTLASIDAGNFI